MGQVVAGVVALGQVGIGVALAVGQVACAHAALGQLAAGGGMAIGQSAVGPGADGTAVWTSHASLLVLALVWAVAAMVLARQAGGGRDGVARFLARARAPAASARPGDVVVAGRAVPARTIEAPVARRPCIAYDLRRVSRDRAPRAETQCEDFQVDDGTASVHVLAADTELLLAPHPRLVANAELRAARGRGGSVAVSSRIDAPGVIERVLLPGDEVLVAGIATRRLDGNGAGSVLIHGGASGPVLVTNRRLTELRAEAWLGRLLALSLLAAEATLFLV